MVKGNSLWSNGVSIESAGMEGVVDISTKPNGKPAMLYQLGVAIRLGKDQVS